MWYFILAVIFLFFVSKLILMCAKKVGFGVDSFLTVLGWVGAILVLCWVALQIAVRTV